MKITKITIIFLVACLTVAGGDIRQAIGNPNQIVQSEVESTAKPIPVSLPVKARVLLNNGDSRSGKVMDINSQHLTIKRDGSNRKEAIANVARIEFDGEVWWPNSSRPIVIHGDEVEMKGKPRRFQVQMDGLEWVNTEEGIAVIKPEAVIGVDDRKGLPRSMRNIINSRYIVSVIEFQSEPQILIITATSHSREE